MTALTYQSRRTIRFVIGVVISLILIALLIRRVRWTDFVDALGSASWPWVMFSLLLFSLNLVLRAFRWRSLLQNRVGLEDALSYLLIGYMGNNLLPARIGEVVRLVLLGEKNQISKSFIGATIVVERLFDLLSLLFFIVMLPLVIEIPPYIKNGIIAVEGVAGAVAILLAFMASAKGSAWLLEKFACFRSYRWLGKGMRVMESFVEGLQVLRLDRWLLVVVIYSVAAWTMVGLSIASSLRAFSLELPWYAAVFTMVVSNIGTMLPSAPGSIGVTHFVLVTALSLWSVDQSVALSFAVVHHGVRYVWMTALGFLTLWREGIKLSQLGRLEK